MSLWPRRWTVLIGVVVAVLMVCGVVLACATVFPAWLVGPDVGGTALTRVDRLKAENDVRSGLLQSMVGFLALGGVALGAAATLRQIRVNREGNTIGLFAKSIDQLASQDISVRQGGVYAMELLSGLDRGYRPAVHALLTAFVCKRVPWPPAGGTGAAAVGLPDDVSAALAALSRREMIMEGDTSELEYVDLRGADLAGMNFRRTCFLGSNLAGAKLAGANLTQATLAQVTLRGSDLSGADLTGADLEGADLDGVVSSAATKWPAGFRP
jgi:hypothetical protein